MCLVCVENKSRLDGLLWDIDYLSTSRFVLIEKNLHHELKALNSVTERGSSSKIQLIRIGFRLRPPKDPSHFHLHVLLTGLNRSDHRRESGLNKEMVTQVDTSEQYLDRGEQPRESAGKHKTAKRGRVRRSYAMDDARNEIKPGP